MTITIKIIPFICVLLSICGNVYAQRDQVNHTVVDRERGIHRMSPVYFAFGTGKISDKDAKALLEAMTTEELEQVFGQDITPDYLKNLLNPREFATQLIRRSRRSDLIANYDEIILDELANKYPFATEEELLEKMDTMDLDDLKALVFDLLEKDFEQSKGKLITTLAELESEKIAAGFLPQNLVNQILVRNMNVYPYRHKKRPRKLFGTIRCKDTSTCRRLARNLKEDLTARLCKHVDENELESITSIEEADLQSLLDERENDPEYFEKQWAKLQSRISCFMANAIQKVTIDKGKQSVLHYYAASAGSSQILWLDIKFSKSITDFWLTDRLFNRMAEAFSNPILSNLRSHGYFVFAAQQFSEKHPGSLVFIGFATCEQSIKEDNWACFKKLKALSDSKVSLQKFDSDLDYDFPSVRFYRGRK